MTAQLLGAGLAAGLECDDVLLLADGHPSAQPGFQLAITKREGVVASADLRVGLMHRGSEKLFEARDYRQLMMLANRHDWMSPFSSELAIALAIEQALGITPPPRATWTRMLLAEATRIAASLAFLATVAPDAESRARLWDARESLLALQERLTGSRVHPMFARIGGVAGGLDAAQLDACTGALEAIAPAAGEAERVADALSGSLAGLAVLTSEDAVDLGASGPVGRASGLDLDLRRDDPYLAYAEVPPAVAVESAGDAAARYRVLASAIGSSLAIARASVDRLRTLVDEPYDVPLPKTVRVPEGMTYAWTEAPFGISGCLLVGSGERTPWRLKIRSAGFGNAQAMQAALVGVPYDRLGDAVMSFFLVIGDIDR